LEDVHHSIGVAGFVGDTNDGSPQSSPALTRDLAGAAHQLRFPAWLVLTGQKFAARHFSPLIDFTRSILQTIDWLRSPRLGEAWFMELN
jgi:hypothetical protein